MKWILAYVDVFYGESLAAVEDKCLDGWEPFAIIWKPTSRLGCERTIQRFWFKRPAEDEE